ncbi:MAG: energy transducer TonB [Burkholderiales bacterium]|nr:energy transducer TonB [Burkholderiales bacterium]
MCLALVIALHVGALLGLARWSPAPARQFEPVRVELIPPQSQPAAPSSAPTLASEVRPAARAPARVVKAPLRAATVVAMESRLAHRAEGLRTAPVELALAGLPNRMEAPAFSGSTAEAAAEAAAPVVAPLAGSTGTAQSVPVAQSEPRATLVPPRLDGAQLSDPQADYPPLARRLGEQGRAVLRVHVSASGRADAIELRASSGSPRLDQAARAAVSRWQFIPARRGEEPVAAWLLVPITFRLDD